MGPFEKGPSVVCVSSSAEKLEICFGNPKSFRHKNNSCSCFERDRTSLQNIWSCAVWKTDRYHFWNPRTNPIKTGPWQGKLKFFNHRNKRKLKHKQNAAANKYSPTSRRRHRGSCGTCARTRNDWDATRNNATCKSQADCPCRHSQLDLEFACDWGQSDVASV